MDVLEWFSFLLFLFTLYETVCRLVKLLIEARARIA